MRKYIFTLAFIGLLLGVYAQHVTETEAYAVAKNFYAQHQNHKSAGQLELYATQVNHTATQKSNTQQVYYYIFNDGNQGFVIVSGNKKAHPVLAYSTQSNFDTTGMPETIRWWMNGYELEMDDILADKSNSTENAEWNQWIHNDTMKVQKATTAVAPLLSTTWNQMEPYNLLCPYDNNEGSRCPTGCVATAMAQVMKYWNFPTQGYGSHSYTPEEHSEYGTQSANFGNTTYQWSNMPNKLTSSSTSAAKSAVSTLMYHCGVSVDMDYDPDGSGAYTVLPDNYINAGYIDARTAMKRFFKYAGSTGYSRTNYSTSAWMSLIKNDLDKGCPVIYAGSGSNGGHCFVCDGYNNSNYFHFNWGWGGLSDGYFHIDSLNPPALGTGGGAGGFNRSQSIIVGLNPNDSVEVSHADLRLYGSMKVTPSTVISSVSFTIMAKIANYGDSTYNGAYTIKVLDSYGNIMGDVEVKNNKSLTSMHYDSLIFTSPGMNLEAGTYRAIAYFYEDSTWKKVKDGNYTNSLTFTVVEGNVDMRLYSAMTFNPSPVIINKPVNLSVNIANYGNIPFVGRISVDIFDENANYIANISEKNDSIPTKSFKKYTFSNDGLTNQPGTYYAYVFYKEQNAEDWSLVNNGNYTNGIAFQLQSDLAISENEHDNSIIYPNPTQGIIHYRNASGEESQIELMDISGKILMSAKANDNADIDISSFSNGIYIMRVTNNGASKNFRIIKQ